MKSNELFKLLIAIGKATAEKLPDIIEPLSVYGKSLSKTVEAVQKGIADYRDGKISEENLMQITAEAQDVVKGEAQQAELPVYMDCVIFKCRSGVTLSEEQQELLASALEEGGTEVISEFVRDYMGGSASEGDDYGIGDAYIGLNFWCDMCTYPYDEAALCRMKNALNELIGCDALDYFVVSGHDENYDEDYEDDYEDD
ncbi:MAG: hypothetical protein NC548_58085 [Lachnospiraceae bacterium]|nr:hypothetical protein [Lachnospiraceae bacterium]